MRRFFYGFKNILARIPVVRTLAGKIYIMLISKRFSGSKKYWVERYAKGGNSGVGSYDELAEYKAEILNAFVKTHNIKSCIEYGCGDGNQLRLATYKSYLGFDVSPKAITRCKDIFHSDASRNFKLMQEYNGESAELVLSLDVVYHLVEDDVFDAYMRRLFSSSDRFIIIFSSNTDEQNNIQAPHVRHRKFTKWIEKNVHGWRLIQHIPNRFSNNNFYEGNSAEFFMYQKLDHS